MDILELILTLIKTNLLDIITILWILWFAWAALGLVVSTAAGWRKRRTLASLSQRYEADRRRLDADAVQLNLDPELIKNTLIRREAELSGDIERMGLDFGILGVLENFRGRIQQRLADLPGALHELEDRLQNIYAALNDFRDWCGPHQLALARMELKRGATGKAAALLKGVRSPGNQQAAEAADYQLVTARRKSRQASAAFLLGQLAEVDFNYFSATQYYQVAADLEPTNLQYLKAAADLSCVFDDLHETGHLLEQVLKMQETLLGPEHPELAQTLNNLGVLRHTQGRHAEAEAFYRWALEICDANQLPRDQEAINLMQNYAAFLEDVGRRREAAAFKARAALA